MSRLHTSCHTQATRSHDALVAAADSSITVAAFVVFIVAAFVVFITATDALIAHCCSLTH